MNLFTSGINSQVGRFHILPKKGRKKINDCGTYRTHIPTKVAIYSTPLILFLFMLLTQGSQTKNWHKHSSIYIRFETVDNAFMKHGLNKCYVSSISNSTAHKNICGKKFIG